MEKVSKRLEQIASIMAQELSDILRLEMNDPRVNSGLLSITKVRISPDLRNATVFFSLLAVDSSTNASWTDAETALNDAAGFLQNVLAKKIYLKVTPRLHFIADRTFETAQRIESILAVYS